MSPASSVTLKLGLYFMLHESAASLPQRLRQICSWFSTSMQHVQAGLRPVQQLPIDWYTNGM